MQLSDSRKRKTVFVVVGLLLTTVTPRFVRSTMAPAVGNKAASPR